MPDTWNAADYRLPAEFEPQEAIWLSWPCNEASSPRTFRQLQDTFGKIAATISRFQTVRINAKRSWHSEVRRSIAAHRGDDAQVELFDHPTNDVWCRDHGPIFLKHRATGDVVATDWEFNAWGGKFPPWDLDNAIPRKVADALGLQRISSPLILEGGAIETEGRGTLLTTEAVLLNPNRHDGRPGDKDAVENELKRILGVDRVVWFKQGIEGDDTDGHIDDLVRFVRHDAVICMTEPDSSNPNHIPLREIREQLACVRSSDGGKLEVIELEMPPPVELPDWRLPRLPASYANFLILNDAVLIPVFDHPRHDAEAVEMVASCFQDREPVPIPSLDLVTEGGALHCISMQQPAAG